MPTPSRALSSSAARGELPCLASAWAVYIGQALPPSGQLTKLVVSATHTCTALVTGMIAIHEIVMQDGHWAQFPYIDCWLGVIKNQPPWIKKCLVKSHVTVVKGKTQGGPPVLPESNVGGDSELAEYRTCSPVTLSGNEDESDTSSGSSPSAPPLPPSGKPPPAYQSIPNDSEHVPQPSAPSESGNKGYYLRKTVESQPVLNCPMREVIGEGGNATFVYTPFSTSDLFNWKNQSPSFREDPEKMRDLFRSIGQTHQPTWADVQMMLQTLLTPEERRLVLGTAEHIAAAKVEAEGAAGRTLRDTCPVEEPRWDNHTAEGRKTVPRVTNLSKLYEVRQGKEENPSAFLRRLYEAFCRFSDLDPEAPDNQRMVNLMFIGQSTADIHKKLQKTEGGAGKPISDAEGRWGLIQTGPRPANSK
uniref:Core shell protein Gag P30 domain-containing protein n=1 Tax=Crocodylus porosus TaxID=8502 RepID=A0A7M4FIG4_CROPO